MYLNHFNLEIQPFQITADPKFIWLGEKYAEALATLKYGILENGGFLLLTGDVGTGKTSLINCLLRDVGNRVNYATVFDPRLEVLEFFNFISAEFNFNKTFDSKGSFLIDFKRFLLDSYYQGKSVLLIIDESQRLEPELMEEIRLLSNIEMPHSKLLNIFFVGQIEFNQTLAEKRNRALRQRIRMRYNLDPLTEPEIKEFIFHRLRKAGSDREIFTRQAVQEIFSFSSGYPRLVNIICDSALVTGYAKDLKQIDAAIIRECAAELRIPCGANESPYKADDIKHEKRFEQTNKKIYQNRAKKYILYGVLSLVLGGLLFSSFSNWKGLSFQAIERWSHQIAGRLSNIIEKNKR